MVSRLLDDSYHGECVRSLTTAGLLLTERTYPPCLEIPPHVHVRPYLCTVLRGGYVETCGGRVWTCTPRTLFLPPSFRAERDGAKRGPASGSGKHVYWD